MATEVGVITSIDEDLAVVKTQRATACDGCSEKDTCHSLGGGREMEFEACNPVHAQVGDRVVIAFKTGQLLSLSFLLYMFPIIAMIIGAMFGNHAGPAYGVDPSLAAAGAGFFFFAMAFVPIKLVDRRANKKGTFRPVIIGIKKKNPNDPAMTAGCSHCHPGP